MMTRLIVWDFDGTLVDSRPQIEAGLDHTVARLGLDPGVRDTWLKCVGLPVREAIERTFVPLGLAYDDVYPVYRSFDWPGSEHLIRPFAGIPELLADLHAAGVRMAIASSKRGEPLRRQAARFGWQPYFDPVVTPDEVGDDTKPHPASLLLALRAHGLAPGDAVMVGDTPFDLEMARRAGVPGIGIAHGVYGAAELEAYGPVGCARDADSLRACLLPRVRA